MRSPVFEFSGGGFMLSGVKSWSFVGKSEVLVFDGDVQIASIPMDEYLKFLVALKEFYALSGNRLASASTEVPR